MQQYAIRELFVMKFKAHFKINNGVLYPYCKACILSDCAVSLSSLLHLRLFRRPSDEMQILTFRIGLNSRRY